MSNDSEVPPWTLFWDMHSGGGSKEPFDKIYIEAPQAEAEIIFFNRFGHSPNRITCTCCGEDYAISEEPTLARASAYHRGCAFDREVDDYIEAPGGRGLSGEYRTVEQYAQEEGVLVIRADEIKPEERVGDVPAQGYVWLD